MKKVPMMLNAVSLGVFIAVFVLSLLDKISSNDAIKMISIAGLSLAMSVLMKGERQ